MTVLIPEKDEYLVPMAIIDGILPSKNTVKSTYESANRSGLFLYSPELSTDFNAFESITGFVNSLERKISNNSPEVSDMFNDESLHHYIITQNILNSNYLEKEDSKIGINFPSLIKNVLNYPDNPNYCINIIVDPHSNMRKEKLKRYVFLWENISKFVSLKRKEYSNFDKYQDFCSELFDEINETYTNPIESTLKKMSLNGSFPGTRIFP